MNAETATLAVPGAARMVRAGLGRRLPSAYVRVGALGGIPATFADFGADPDHVLRQLGIPFDAFGHPDNALPFEATCRMLSLGVELSGREDFGLLISARTSSSTLGLIGFLMNEARDVRTALNDMVRYFHHHDSMAVPFLRVHGDLVELGYAMMQAPLPGIEQINDAAIAIGCAIMRALCGPAFAPVEITLARRPPSVPARYEQHFGAPVRFNAERSALLFDHAWLDRPIPSPDPALRAMLQEQIDLIEEQACTVAEKVRRLLRMTLLSGRGGAEDVAALLKMSRRALARRLEAEGVSFRALVDEIRREIAEQLLASTGMSITQVALAVGFSEASAFSRAFHKWTGLPPSDWRKVQARR